MADDDSDLGFRPPHPGEYLREDILPALSMSVKEFAGHLGVSRQTMSRLVNEKADVSTDMAIRLGRAFKNGARFWLALQMQHDIWERQRTFSVDVSPLSWSDDHGRVA
jgi:antitoxin HigA-1